MSGCPIASLPDYRRIVLSRLPPGSILDDESEIQKSIIEENSIFTTDDAILLKELVADGLLDEDELLENEPVTRPFTAMGLRPKTTQFTPFQRPSSGNRGLKKIFCTVHFSTDFFRRNYFWKDKELVNYFSSPVIHLIFKSFNPAFFLNSLST